MLLHDLLFIAFALLSVIVEWMIMGGFLCLRKITHGAMRSCYHDENYKDDDDDMIDEKAIFC